MNPTSKRISAAVLSLALGFTIAGAPMLAPVASAQISITAGEASTVTLGSNVSLTINKYDGLPVTDPADLANLAPLDATFTIEKVLLNNNLNTLAGWQELSGYTPTTAPKDTAFTPISVTTDATTGRGVVRTTDDGTIIDGTDVVDPTFVVGAYVVTEVAKAGYSIAPPFLVTLPFTNSTNNDWNYNQVVHPKNQADITVEKGVEDLGATIGSTLNYTISAPLPAGNLTSLEVLDDLPDELGTATNIVVSTRINNGAPLVELPLIDTTPVTTGGTDAVPNNLSIVFGELDRAELESRRVGNPGLELVVTFSAVITSLPTNGTIVNHAVINLPGGLTFSTDDPNDPDDGAQTHLGDLIIRNVNNEEPAVLITEGSATYELWRCQANGAGGFNVISQVSAATDPAGPAVDTFTTTGGTITLYGVQAIDWVNGAAPTAAIGQDLCVVELESPDGYELNPEPTQVEYVDPPVGYNMEADVIHLASDDVITLPATGGNGTMILIGAGVLVAAAGGAAAVRGNRARKN
ncbi:surface-anchored fimbrial subunit [Corynebacterium glutamicum]|uniref:SpaH/EbpB family LPXTG-anchored major pilin n=1 Tax=Corynebacterium glutamicum TaxID=1718 RepID=UPI00097B1BE0|nr:SpaH/EbpB family LPXTG-anchored major pilin [Corynebacterium glutamicum]GAV98393.1 surface-anchored fimbrial subunit [Corynebacterium glutamicum]